MRHVDPLAIFDLIYGIASRDATWQDALPPISRALGGVAAGLRFECFAPPSLTQVWAGLEPDLECACFDPWAQVVSALVVDEGRARDADAPRDAFGRSALPAAICAAHGVDEVVGCVFERSATELWTLAVMKPAASKPFDGEDARFLASIVPHLRRAARLERQLARAERDGAESRGALDALQVGVFLVDDAGQVVRANPAAERTLGDGLVIGPQGLGARSPAATHALRGQIASASRGLGGGGAVRIPRPSGLPDLAVVALPLPVARTAADPPSAVAMVVIVDPSAAPAPLPTLLGQLYGLTTAEARVAVALGRGLAPKEIASAAGTAYNTVRYQLGQVYAKTGAQGQSDLVRLVTMLGIAA